MELLGPCGWWSEAVRAVTRRGPDGVELPAAAILGPELDSDGALDRARERAAPWLNRAAPGVLGLHEVTEAEGRSAWVYDATDGVSLGLVLAAPGDPMPVRVAAELVAACADILEKLGHEAWQHPGPEPDDILLLADGSVRIAGFVGPFARTPAKREPHGAEDGSALVWRLGMLLAQTLTQSPPPPATDRPSHEAMLRRLLIKVMSRSGPTFPGRLRDWLVGMISWDPDERPVLQRVGAGLREVASTMPQPSLSRWCAAHILALRARSDGGDPFRTPEPPLDTGPLEIPVVRLDNTEEITFDRSSAWLVEPPDLDDTTVVSTEGDDNPFRQAHHDRERERGSIPVQVGPPPEAVPRPTRLPHELFSNEPPRERSVEPVVGLDPLVRLAMILLSLFLVVIGAIVSWYLFG